MGVVLVTSSIKVKTTAHPRDFDSLRNYRDFPPGFSSHQRTLCMGIDTIVLFDVGILVGKKKNVLIGHKLLPRLLPLNTPAVWFGRMLHLCIM